MPIEKQKKGATIVAIFSPHGGSYTSINIGQLLENVEKLSQSWGYYLRVWLEFGTLDTENAGGVGYGELAKSVQALDIGAGTRVP